MTRQKESSYGRIHTFADSKALWIVLTVTRCLVLIRVHPRKSVAQSYEPMNHE